MQSQGSVGGREGRRGKTEKDVTMEEGSERCQWLALKLEEGTHKTHSCL